MRRAHDVSILVAIAVLSVSTAWARSGDPREAPQGSASEQRAGLFRLLRTVQVTPDGNFLGGGFVRIEYLSSTGRFLVTFNATLDQDEGDCSGAGRAWEEYDADLRKIGRGGVLSCDGGVDVGSLLIGDHYYLASMHREGESIGWKLVEFDARSWASLASHFLVLDYPREVDDDPMVAYVNGEIDVSGQYNASGTPPDLAVGGATFHYFFSPELDALGSRHLTDTPHVGGSSMIFADGIYHFVTANAFLGDLVVMQYDQDWKYLGSKLLKREAHWSTGLVSDGDRFYLAYMDTSQRAGPSSLPVYLNVRLAAFDRSWNLVQDVAVSEFTPASLRQPGRPWVLLRGGRLYVSYDLDTIDPDTHEENHAGQAVVSVYQLAADPPSSTWLATPALPGFQFQVRVKSGGTVVPVREETDCVAQTLCLSAAVPGRSELFLRIVGPKPNGYLWPNIVKFSTSQVEVWVKQLSSGEVQYYQLPQVTADSGELPGMFDRLGFQP